MPRAIARVLLAGGWSVSVTPGMLVLKEKRLEDANVVAKVADIRLLQTHYVRWHDTEGFASLHPRLRVTRFARAFDLSGRAAVKRVIISLCESVRLFMLSFANVVILFY